MFGHVERPVHVARHFVRARDAPGGDGRVHRGGAAAVRAHGQRPSSCSTGPGPGPTFRETLLLHAVARIAFARLHRQHPGVVGEDGPARRRPGPAAGCNDLGGTLMDENISRAAGANHGQYVEEDVFRAHRGAPRPRRSSSAPRCTAASSTDRPARRRRSRRRPRPHPRDLRVPPHRAGHRCRRAGPGGPGRDVQPPPTSTSSGIGNALVDVLSHEADDFVDAHGLVKGAHDAHRRGPGRRPVRRRWARASRCRAGRRPTPWPASPRSAGRAAYIGRVRDDQLGEVFAHDIRAAGVEFHNPAGDRRARPPAAA